MAAATPLAAVHAPNFVKAATHRSHLRTSAYKMMPRVTKSVITVGARVSVGRLALLGLMFWLLELNALVGLVVLV